MAGAAYSENAHREGVSTLEQARALAKYIDRGVFATKQALADALNVSRSHVSNLTSYAEIPSRVLEALGDWRKCTFRDANSLLKATREPVRREQILDAAERLIAGDPQLGFQVRLTVLLGQKPASSGEAEGLRDDSGRILAERKRGRRTSAIAFTSGPGEALADFVWAKMPSLIEEFRRYRGDQK
jgi:ParB-like chromosome segregation protein Spo0J